MGIVKKQNVILLSGYAQSGKSTAQRQIMDVHGYADINFADPLYDMLGALYSRTPNAINRAKAHGDLMPGTNKTFREGLQTIGTEWGRDCIDENIWPMRTVSRIRDNTQTPGFIIGDCRFVSEYEYLLAELDPTKYELSLIHISSNSSDPQTQHRSEKDIGALARRANYCVHNMKNAMFFEKLNEVMKDILKPDNT